MEHAILKHRAGHKISVFRLNAHRFFGKRIHGHGSNGKGYPAVKIARVSSHPSVGSRKTLSRAFFIAIT
jgi:hypothetical protein